MYRDMLIDQGRFPATNRWRQVGQVLFVGSTDIGDGLQCNCERSSKTAAPGGWVVIIENGST